MANVSETANSTGSRNLRDALLWGASNADIVDWGKLSERIARSPPPLSESEYCERLLQIANGAQLSDDQWNQIVGLSTVNVRNNSGRTLPLRAAPADRIAWLRENLTAFIHGNKATRKAMSASAASDLNNNRVLIIPSYSAAHGRRQDRVISTGNNSALVYGLWLLFDAGREHAEKLRQCRYSECRAFFFKRAEKLGAPVRLYCSDEHAELGMREAARQRMQRHRKRRG
jgi:hypothetical protein